MESSIFRYRIALWVIGIYGLLVIYQLFNLQIVNNTSFEEKSQENSIKKNVLSPPRGILFDRNFQVLVANKPSYTVRVTPADYDTSNNKILDKRLGEKPGFMKKILRQNRRFSSYIPVKIKRDADLPLIAWYEEHWEELKGIDYIVELQRDYSYGVKGSHIFGFIREISASQLRKMKEQYDMGDFLGASGIEKTYEDYLRGKKGYQFTLVDSRQKTVGRYLEGNADIEPGKGFDLVLSIDAGAQKKAEEMLEGKNGAVVAIDPSTGEVLVLVSKPDYDLSRLSTVISSDIWAEFMNDPQKPLFNRATMSIYPPGSTFKMVSAITALEEKIITPDFSVNCGGGYFYGNRFFKCTHVHGHVDLEQSIEKSCNTFYYQLILKIGLERWSDYASRFGFGRKTDLDITEENAGILPTEKYYKRIYGNADFPSGVLLSLGIGQGEISATPVQLAQYCALLANKGKSKKPHIVKGLIHSEDLTYIPLEFEDIDVHVSDETFDIVRNAMLKVVQGAGTATHLRMPELLIAGKTGTAQNPHGKDHAIFIGFAPFDNPKIAVAVMVENSGFGSTYAAPIAKEVITQYLKPSPPSQNLISSAGKPIDED